MPHHEDQSPYVRKTVEVGNYMTPMKISGIPPPIKRQELPTFMLMTNDFLPDINDRKFRDGYNTALKELEEKGVISLMP